LSKAYDTRDSI